MTDDARTEPTPAVEPAPTDDDRAKRLADAAALAERVRKMREEADALEREQWLREQEALRQDIANGMQNVLELVTSRDANIKRLVCHPMVTAGDDEAGIEACKKAGAMPGCEFVIDPYVCPRRRQADVRDRAAIHLSAGNVQDRECGLIMAHLRPDDANRVPLRDTDPLRLMRAVLRRKPMVVQLENGAQVDRHGKVHRGRVVLRGDEIHIGLFGNRGVGKTVAAAYAIARLGGLYTLAAQYTRPAHNDGVVLAACKGAGVLVVDQVGRENRGESAFGLSQLEEVIDHRHAGKRITVAVGNMEWSGRGGVEGFIERYEGIVADRWNGAGVFVLFAGESMR